MLTKTAVRAALVPRSLSQTYAFPMHIGKDMGRFVVVRQQKV